MNPFKILVSAIFLVFMLIISSFLLTRYAGIQLPFFKEIWKEKQFQGFIELTPSQNAVHQTALALKRALETLSNDPSFEELPEVNVFFNSKVYRIKVKDEKDLFRLIDFCADYYAYHYEINKKAPEYCPVNITFDERFRKYIKGKKVFFNRLSPVIYSNEEELRNFIKKTIKDIDVLSGCDNSLFSSKVVFVESSSPSYSMISLPLEAPSFFYSFSITSFSEDDVVSETIAKSSKQILEGKSLYASSQKMITIETLADYLNKMAYSFSSSQDLSGELVISYSPIIPNYMNSSVYFLPSNRLFEFSINKENIIINFMNVSEIFNTSNCREDVSIFIHPLFDIVMFNFSFKNIKEIPSLGNVPKIPSGAMISVNLPQEPILTEEDGKIIKKLDIRGINLFGDPHYIIYYSYFPEGYEKYWITPFYANWRRNFISWSIAIAADLGVFKYVTLGLRKLYGILPEEYFLKKIMRAISSPFVAIGEAFTEGMRKVAEAWNKMLGSLGYTKTIYVSDRTISLLLTNMDEYSKIIGNYEDLKNLKIYELASSSDMSKAIQKMRTKIPKLSIPETSKTLLEIQLDMIDAISKQDLTSFYKTRSLYDLFVLSSSEGMSVSLDTLKNIMNQLKIDPYVDVYYFSKSVDSILKDVISEQTLRENIKKVLINNLDIYYKGSDNFLIEDLVRLKTLQGTALTVQDKIKILHELDASAYYKLRSWDFSPPKGINKEIYNSIVDRYITTLTDIKKNILFQNELYKSFLIPQEVSSKKILTEFYSYVDDYKINQKIDDLLVYTYYRKKTGSKYISFLKTQQYKNMEFFKSLKDLDYDTKRKLLIYLLNSDQSIIRSLEEDISKISIPKDFELSISFSKDQLDIFDYKISTQEVKNVENLYLSLLDDSSKKALIERNLVNIYSKNPLFDTNSRKYINSLLKTKNKYVKNILINSIKTSLRAVKDIYEVQINDEIRNKLDLIFSSNCRKEINLLNLQEELIKLAQDKGISPGRDISESEKRDKLIKSVENFLSSDLRINDKFISYELYESLSFEYGGIIDEKNNIDLDKLLLDYLEFSCIVYNELRDEIQDDLKTYAFMMTLGTLYGKSFKAISDTILANALLSYSTVFSLAPFSLYYTFLSSYYDYANEKHERSDINTIFVHSIAFTDPSTADLFYKEYKLDLVKFKPVTLSYDTNKYKYLEKEPFREKGFVLVSPCYGKLIINQSSQTCHVFNGAFIKENNTYKVSKNIGAIKVNLFIYKYFVDKIYTDPSKDFEQELLNFLDSEIMNLSKIIDSIDLSILMYELMDDKNLWIVASFFRPKEVIHDCDPYKDFKEFYECVKRIDEDLANNHLISAYYAVLGDPYTSYMYFKNNILTPDRNDLVKNFLTDVSADQNDLLVLFTYLYSRNPNIFKLRTHFFEIINLINDALRGSGKVYIPSYYYGDKGKNNDVIINRTIDKLSSIYFKYNFLHFSNYSVKGENFESWIYDTTLFIDIPFEFYKYNPHIFTDDPNSLPQLINFYINYTKYESTTNQYLLNIKLNDIKNERYLNFAFTDIGNMYNEGKSNFQVFYTPHIYTTTIDPIFSNSKNTSRILLYLLSCNVVRYLSTFNEIMENFDFCLRANNVPTEKILSFDDLFLRDEINFFSKDLLKENSEVYLVNTLKYSIENGIDYFKILDLIESSGYVYVNTSIDRFGTPICRIVSDTDAIYYNITNFDNYNARFYFFDGACFPSNLGLLYQNIRQKEKAKAIFSTAWMIATIASGVIIGMASAGAALPAWAIAIASGIQNTGVQLVGDTIAALYFDSSIERSVSQYLWPNHKED
ncbi:MAG: hypothetical protein QW524_03045 [Candidatus Woesearchaeota archaeon]